MSKINFMYLRPVEHFASRTLQHPIQKIKSHQIQKGHSGVKLKADDKQRQKKNQNRK